jgi:2-polyprenyl-6-methoxyphenol hydroxylase-like FAD-dependent oxidoreductase
MAPSGNSQSHLYDVIVVGAGPVGAALAWKLAGDGYRVCVCEEYEEVPTTLRTEHLSHQAISLARELGLFERIRPALIPLDSTAHLRNGHLVRANADGPYLAPYDQLVRSLRQGLGKVTTMVWDSAVEVSAQGRVKNVRLKSGGVVCGWMVVIASGANGGNFDWLGLTTSSLCRDYSLTFSWDMELEDPERMTHSSIVFRTTHTSHGYGTLKLFDCGAARIRANFLTYWNPGDRRHQAMMSEDPTAILNRTVEGLLPYVGPFRITSPVGETPTHLTRAHGGEEAGLVLAGDASNQVAPSASLGLRKGWHDVRILSELMPRWERESRSGQESLSLYYFHPAKNGVDGEALARSLRERKIAIDWRPEWATRRLIGNHIPDWLESAVVKPALYQSLNLIRGDRSGLDS